MLKYEIRLYCSIFFTISEQQLRNKQNIKITCMCSYKTGYFNIKWKWIEELDRCLTNVPFNPLHT